MAKVAVECIFAGQLIGSRAQARTYVWECHTPSFKNFVSKSMNCPIFVGKSSKFDEIFLTVKINYEDSYTRFYKRAFSDILLGSKLKIFPGARLKPPFL